MEEKVVRKRAPRRVATKTVTRKAPVRAAESVPSEKRSYLPLIAIFVFIVIVAGSIAVGFSDDGQINVSNTISERKSSGTPEEQEQLRNIPVQQSRTAVPDGGLVPTADADPAVAPPPAPPASTTVASSSVASSTEETATTDSSTEAPTETSEPTVAE